MATSSDALPDTESIGLEEAALFRLLVEKSGFLHGFAERRIPPRLRALVAPADIIQEVCMAAFRSRHTFIPSGPGGAERWLVGICRNKLSDALAAAQRLVGAGIAHTVREADCMASSFDLLLSNVAGSTDTPSRDAATTEARVLLAASLERLPTQQREAVMLRFIKGRSHKDVAAAMTKSVPAVRGLILRGVAALRHHVGDPSAFFSDVASGVPENRQC